MVNKATDIKSVDIVIIGGGIAGLWTLARLRQSGYQAMLVEADHLGCVQSGASQGIIHGGTKYALTGKLTHSSQAIQQMPQRWKDCLEGRGEVDLSQAKKLSEHQYLWSNKSLAAKITGFFASKVMTSRMRHLQEYDYIPPFKRSGFSGELYQLDEPVLDIQSVIETVRQQFSEVIFQGHVKDIIKLPIKNSEFCCYQLTFSEQKLLTLKEDLIAKTVILTAGAGNENLLSSLNFSRPKMQRRPLLMPMLKAKKSILPRMYAHCLGASALPKMTITAHPLSDDETVWYLGGEIAEQGVGRSVEAQVQAAKKELCRLMPWMDFSQCQWSALAIDRAEPEMTDGSRPVEPAVFRQHQVITAWPVKLAMAPIMVDKIIDELEQLGMEKNSPPPLLNTEVLELMPMAHTSLLPWEKVSNWL